MEDYLIALRSRDNTPASLLRMDKQHEEEMINNYTSDIKAKIQGKKNPSNQSNFRFLRNPLSNIRFRSSIISRAKKNR